MEHSTIARISNWAALIAMLILVFFLGSYASCKMSDGKLLPDLSCTDIRKLDLCVFEDKIYKLNRPPIDLNLTLEEINET